MFVKIEANFSARKKTSSKKPSKMPYRCCARHIPNDRMAKEKGMRQHILFGDGKTFCYLEHCCPNMVEEEGTYCNQHMSRFHPKYAHSKLCQWNYCFKHGSIKDPYTEESKIYGSPWYEKWYRVYGKPNAADIKIAEEHKEAVRQLALGMPQIKITDYIMAQTQSAPSTPSASALVQAQAQVQVQVQPKSPKPKQKRTIKKKDETESTHSSSVSSNSSICRPLFVPSGPIRFYECTDTPLEVKEVVYVSRL